MNATHLRRCRACGAEQSETDRFCGACGAATPLPREEPGSSRPPSRHTSPADCFRAANAALARVRLARRKPT